MKTLTVMRCRQVARFAGFLEEHPGFSPELFGENASVIGFRLGRSLLSVDEMERLIATQPLFDAQEAAMLLAPSGSFRTLGL